MTEEFKILQEYYKVKRGINLLETPAHSGLSFPIYLDHSDANFESAKELVWEFKPKDEIKILNTTLRLYQTPMQDNKMDDKWVSREPLIACYFIYQFVDGGIKELGVWRHARYPYLAQELFFNYYLPTYKFIESDNLHSTDGRHYWYRLTTKAKNMGKSVTVLDVSTNNEIDVDTLPEQEHNEVYGKNGDVVFRIYK